MVVVVSGLQAISSEILEAADLFGAGLWKRVRYVILPMLRPSLQVALILRTILALQVFAVVIALSGGDIVTVLANEAYRQYYDLRNVNVAAAYAGLILLLSMVSAVFYLRLVRSNEEATVMTALPGDRCAAVPGIGRDAAQAAPTRAAPPAVQPRAGLCPGDRDLSVGAGAHLVHRLDGLHHTGIRARLSEGGAALHPLLVRDDALLPQLQGIIPGTINSIVVAIITLVLSTIIAAPAGYAISRYIFRGRDTYRLSILAVRAFPVVILAIPLAVVFINFGIYDSVYSLALMHTALTLPTTILVIGSVFASIPYELEEAAQVFGCSPLQAFRTVVLPLVAPGIAAASIFTFVMSWNEVFAASILTLQNRTLPAQVLSALNQSSEAYQFAGAFFMMIPALIFILLIRRYLFNMWGQVTK